MWSKHLNGTVLEATSLAEKGLPAHTGVSSWWGRQTENNKQRTGLKGMKTVKKNCRIRCRVMGLKPPVLDHGKEGPSDKVTSEQILKEVRE